MGAGKTEFERRSWRAAFACSGRCGSEVELGRELDGAAGRGIAVGVGGVDDAGDAAKAAAQEVAAGVGNPFGSLMPAQVVASFTFNMSLLATKELKFSAEMVTVYGPPG